VYGGYWVWVMPCDRRVLGEVSPVYMEGTVYEGYCVYGG
jgi:hypothetical protein